MKLLDLFSGIGGFSYGLERIGFKTVAFCEMDKYCKLVLQKHWKGVKIYNDVREITKARFETDGIEFPEVITGGFPCQPFSVAGKRQGTSDDRHLWPEMFRIIKEFKPRWVIGENVKGLINLENGMVFETVCTDLEGEGYEVRAFNIPAAGVGAPHRRERIWIVANSRRTLQQGTELGKTNEDETRKEDADQHQRSSSPSKSNVADTDSRLSDRENEEVQSGGQTFDTSSQRTDVANTERKRLEGLSEQSSTIGKQDERLLSRNESSGDQTKRTDVANTESKSSNSEHNGKESRETSEQEQIESRRSGSWSLREANWIIEPDVGRVAHGVPGRVHRLKALGNSIVPKIAEEIGKAIVEADDIEYQSGGAYKAMLKLFRDNLK